MTSIAKISNRLSSKCPHCNQFLDMTEFGAALFQVILRELSSGYRVEITGFGVFSTSVLTAQKKHGLLNNAEILSDKLIIRFRTSSKAKAIVNRSFRDKQNKGNI